MSANLHPFQVRASHQIMLSDMPIPEMVAEMGKRAHQATRDLSSISTDMRSQVLSDIARLLRQNKSLILCENEKDQTFAQKKGVSSAMMDRLILTSDRIDAMGHTCLDIAALPDPLNQVLSEWQQPSGLVIQRVSVPLGVIGMVYEARPNVTIDAACLCFKSGNAVILRSGSESFHSSVILAGLCRQALAENGLNEEAIQIVPTIDRDAVGCLLRQDQTIDVIIPRGGKSLVARISEESRVPVLKHLDGINHTYIHRSADLQIARSVSLNAKMRRVSICGATETLLIDQDIAKKCLPDIISDLHKAGCEIRGDEKVHEIASKTDIKIISADQQDWATEYLQAIIAIKVVSSLAEACAHIDKYGSQHTEAIIATDQDAIDVFSRQIDAAIVMINTSTQFADGGEFGMGAEIGIATGKIHARGPVGVSQLTSMKYVVRSSGAVRP